MNPSKINSKRSPLRWITNKLSKANEKERISKVIEKKRNPSGKIDLQD